MTLRIEGLSVHYGSTTVLDGLDLNVPTGELFVLLGGSGSGKTTLLRTIAGFLQPTSGSLTLDEIDLTPLPPYRRPVNTMFQSYALFPHMSVAENIAFGLRHLPRVERAVRVAEMLALVRLDGYGTRRPDALSGGQQQRVALARSLAPRPRLLLLDEPLSALDRGLRAETRADLVRLQRRLGTSFIVVTHDQDEALGLADRVGVMQAGRLAQVGTPQEVYERPNSRAVATFLGAANILPGELNGDRFVLTGLGQAVRVEPPSYPPNHPRATPRDRHEHSAATGSRDRDDGGKAEAPAFLALRPERLRLNDPGAVNQLRGVITSRDYIGGALTVAVRLPDGTALQVTQPLADGFAAAPCTDSTEVSVGWPPEAGILLAS